MGKQIYFIEMNSEAGNYLFDFFHSENLAFLFISLYNEVKTIIPDVIIRGIPGQIFGVSRKRERCLFYITFHPDKPFRIHFKSFSGEFAFLKENTERIAAFTIREARHRKQNPEDYQIDTQKISQTGVQNQCLITEKRTQDEAPEKNPVMSVDNKLPEKELSISFDHKNPADKKICHKKNQVGHELSGVKKIEEKKYIDKKIKCQDCGKIFIFSAGEQKFYDKKWLPEPKRCKQCRIKNKELKKEELKYIGLRSITDKLKTKRDSFLHHAELYGPGYNVTEGPG